MTQSREAIAHEIIVKALKITEKAIDQVFGKDYAIKNPYLVARLIPSVVPMADAIVRQDNQGMKLGGGNGHESN